MLTSFTIMGEPVAKPRMTKSDKWKKRDCVVRYRLWADEARLAATGSPLARVEADVIAIHVYAHVLMPESWSPEKKEAHAGRIHRSTSDSDNILKSVMDALFVEDKKIALVQCLKLWCRKEDEPRIDVFFLVLVDWPPVKVF